MDSDFKVLPASSFPSPLSGHRVQKFHIARILPVMLGLGLGLGLKPQNVGLGLGLESCGLGIEVFGHTCPIHCWILCF